MHSSRPLAGVLVTRRSTGYKDEPGRLYHFPRAKYEKTIKRLLGHLVLIYEPRRGGVSANSKHGGKSAFVACSYIDELWVDPTDETHAFVSLRYFLDFTTAVAIAATAIDGHSLQSAVKEIPYDEAARIVASGIAFPASQSGERRQGLIETDVLSEIRPRSVRIAIRNETVRDASFRLRVVEQVYEGRCALTGVKMTNGNGRAEADAAHIRPVEAGGPDTVRNGLALMKSLHWAFDRGLVSLTDSGDIITKERGIDDQIRRLLPTSGRAFLPVDANERPHPSYLAWHREHVFKISA